MVQIIIPKEDLAELCERHHVSKLLLFGSALRSDFGETSDVDLLVEFAADHVITFARLDELERALSQVFGREVDLGELRSVQQDPNYIRRKQILSDAQVIYAK